MYDLVLKGGRVIDPSQNLDCVGDVAVADGRIAAVDDGIDSSRAREVFDVAGRIITGGGWWPNMEETV